MFTLAEIVATHFFRHKAKIAKSERKHVPYDIRKETPGQIPFKLEHTQIKFAAPVMRDLMEKPAVPGQKADEGLNDVNAIISEEDDGSKDERHKN